MKLKFPVLVHELQKKRKLLNLEAQLEESEIKKRQLEDSLVEMRQGKEETVGITSASCTIIVSEWRLIIRGNEMSS